jgi:hypothetical protein
VVNGADQTELPAAVTVSGKSFTAKVSLPLTEAQYQARVVGYDLAGNVSQPGSKDFQMVKVDVTAPDTPALTAPVAYDGNLYVTSNTAALKGTAEPGVTVYAQVGSRTPVKAVAKADGTFSLSATFTGNTADLKLWAEDAARNASDETLFTLNYDKTAATVGDLELSVGDIGFELTRDAKGKWTHPAGAIAVRQAWSISITGITDSTVAKVLVNDKPVPVTIRDTEFTADIASLVKGGANSLTLKVYDQAGNATSVPVTFTLAAPKVTIAEKDVVTKTGGTSVTFTVTAAEEMKEIWVNQSWDEGLSSLNVTITPLPKNKWTVTATLPETGRCYICQGS